MALWNSQIYDVIRQQQQQTLDSMMVDFLPYLAWLSSYFNLFNLSAI